MELNNEIDVPALTGTTGVVRCRGSLFALVDSEVRALVESLTIPANCVTVLADSEFSVAPETDMEVVRDKLGLSRVGWSLYPGLRKVNSALLSNEISDSTEGSILTSISCGKPILSTNVDA